MQLHLKGMVSCTIFILYKILFRVYQWKNLENRSIFREVIDMSRVSCFLTHIVHALYYFMQIETSVLRAAHFTTHHTKHTENRHTKKPRLPAVLTNEYRTTYKRGFFVTNTRLLLRWAGFLSTEDNSAPGNYAILDLVAALHWLKENIAAFGGDADQISLLGHGYGAALVNILLISPITKGKRNLTYGLDNRPLSPASNRQPIPGIPCRQSSIDDSLAPKPSPNPTTLT